MEEESALGVIGWVTAVAGVAGGTGLEVYGARRFAIVCSKRAVLSANVSLKVGALLCLTGVVPDCSIMCWTRLESDHDFADRCKEAGLEE